MIFVKSEREIDLMREPCAIVRDTLAAVGSAVRPGVSTAELDRVAREYIRARGAEPSCLGYCGYPASICASVNEVIVHGIPSEDIVLKEGDIVSIDLCAYKNGFHGDGARTFAVGAVSEEKQKLMRVTEECFWKAVEHLRAGTPLYDIGATVQAHAESNGFRSCENTSGTASAGRCTRTLPSPITGSAERACGFAPVPSSASNR